MALNMTPRLQNGNLGVFVYNASDPSPSYFSRLWNAGKLLNPVIGMRFHPENSKLTIGALDPADYEGEINWVQLETQNPSWNSANLFKIDGFKGYNGSFFPYGASASALTSINSCMYLRSAIFITPLIICCSIRQHPHSQQFPLHLYY